MAAATGTLIGYVGQDDEVAGCRLLTLAIVCDGSSSFCGVDLTVAFKVFDFFLNFFSFLYLAKFLIYSDHVNWSKIEQSSKSFPFVKITMSAFVEAIAHHFI